MRNKIIAYLTIGFGVVESALALYFLYTLITGTGEFVWIYPSTGKELIQIPLAPIVPTIILTVLAVGCIYTGSRLLILKMKNKNYSKYFMYSSLFVGISAILTFLAIF